MAPLPIGTFVETFLDQSKEDARRLIRHEMESMLDPLVESLFGQLKAKFADYVGAAPGFHQELAFTRENEAQMIRHNLLPTIVNSQQYQSLDNANHSIDANSQLNSTNHHEPPLMSIKEEINDPSNVQLEPQRNDDSVNSLSSAHKSFPQPMNPPTSTDESLNTEMQQQQQSHFKDNDYEYDNDDDEDECDCDECVYGIIDLKEEDDDDVQLIDGHQSGPPVKRPRMCRNV